LVDGSNPASPNETDTGTFTIDTLGDSLATVTVGGVNVTGGGEVVGSYGTLTVIATDGAYTWSYTLSDNTLDHPANPGSGTSEGIVDSFSVTVTDSDGDVSASDTLTVAVLDDGPDVLATTDLIFANSSQTGTGVFDYSIGADGIGYTGMYSDFSTITMMGTVGATAIGSPTVNWISEDATTAVFAISFSYVPGPNVPAVDATGTLTFDKVGGTYTLALDEPIVGFSVFTTSDALNFQGYVPGGMVEDNSGPADAVVARLTDNFFVQFTGIAEPGGGTGTNNLGTVDGPGGGDGTTGTFAEGELFTQDSTSVTVSSTAAGVAGNTIQKGEVLDMDFFTFDPGGHMALAPDALVTDMFIKFDGVGSEDLVVVLKLINPDTLVTSTKAIIVENSDIFTSEDALPDKYDITLDNNDGVVIIERNDYNFGGENWLIEGAQVLVSTEGITGDGINLDPNFGESGGSEDDGTQAFDSSTVDSDVLKITDIGLVTVVENMEDAELTFEFEIIDGDGDETATQTLNVHIEGNGTFVGTGAAESIQGSDGVDTISDGSGSDFVIGGGGADIIDLVADDEIDFLIYELISEAGDTVNGFDSDDAAGGGDIVDLADLLNTDTFVGTTLAEAEAGGYVSLVDNGGDAEVWVDLDGGGGGGSAVLLATLNGIDLGTDATLLDDNIIVG
jgi:hypothetical protein